MLRVTASPSRINPDPSAYSFREGGGPTSSGIAGGGPNSNSMYAGNQPNQYGSNPSDYAHPGMAMGQSFGGGGYNNQQYNGGYNTQLSMHPQDSMQAQSSQGGPTSSDTAAARDNLQKVLCSWSEYVIYPGSMRMNSCCGNADELVEELLRTDIYEGGVAPGNKFCPSDAM